MGVGKPEDLVEGVRRGIDMFDCVMPTRNARNGHLFVTDGVVKSVMRSINQIHRRWMRNVTAIPAAIIRVRICIIWIAVMKSLARA